MRFFLVFHDVFLSVLEIFFIVFAGFFLFKFKLLSNEGVRDLNGLTINVFLPCLIFEHLIVNFRFDASGDWWLYPLLGIGISLTGYFIGMIFLSLDKKNTQRNEFISLVAFQNCGYLPLVLVKAIFPQPLANILFINIFLFIQGFNLIFWSIGPLFLNNQKIREVKLKHFFNAPFIALLLSFMFLTLKMQAVIPRPLLDAVKLIGDCTLPVALITLGAILAACPRFIKGTEQFLLEVIAAKLVIMPLLVFLFLFYFKCPQELTLLLILQAAMPSAINLSVLSYQHNARCDIISQAVLLTHIAGVFTIPVFISLYYLM